MPEQLDFFGDPMPLDSAGASVWPEGFKLEPELLSADDERLLLAQIRTLPFREFDFHGYVGKRRTVSFGWAYDFASESLRPADAIPEFLLPVRALAAAFAELRPEQLKQVLVSEYGPGAGIGWHRDKAVFGDVVGVSLLSGCSFRLRRQTAAGWERVTVEARRRSAYLLRGAARTEWEHSIPNVGQTRYSITFRTMK
jgi:alkylated DNA repair dioxygenase AlkB